MNTLKLISLVILSLALSPFASAENLNKAEFYGQEAYAYVSFWQTNFLPANQGTCVVEFMFGSYALVKPIEDLTFTIRVLDKTGKEIGVGSFQLLGSLGGPRAEAYKKAMFEGLSKWPGMDDGELSPLCDEGTVLIFEEATGKQAGKKVELIRNGQLRYTTQRVVNVKVK